MKGEASGDFRVFFFHLIGLRAKWREIQVQFIYDNTTTSQHDGADRLI